jgi:hypothetical protein
MTSGRVNTSARSFRVPTIDPINVLPFSTVWKWVETLHRTGVERH